MTFLRNDSYKNFLQVGQSLHVQTMPFVRQLSFGLFFGGLCLPLSLFGAGLFGRGLLFYYRESVNGKNSRTEG